MAELSAATGGTREVHQGDDNPNTLIGTGAPEELYGQGGDDSIQGGGGDDHIWGDDGADTVFGGAGNDAVFGSEGHDSLIGGHGNDLLAGGAGDDTLVGGAGTDALHGREGDDLYIWSPGDGSDSVYDSLGVDTLQLLDTGLTTEQFRNGLQLLEGGIEMFSDRFSADGRSINVEGLSGSITIGGETIRFSGIDRIELVDVPTRGVASATG
jgi:Ca2+-binding RTX toxin-like protein